MMLPSRGKLVRSDAGFALITVIGMAGVLALITTVITTRALNDLRQVGIERRGEQAVHAADAGIDRWMARLRVNPADCNVASVPATFTPNEKSWVLATADQLAQTPSNIIRTSEGDHVVVKPGNGSCPVSGAAGIRRLIYSVGYTPSYSTPAGTRRTRIVRVDYDFLPVPLEVAILTDGPLSIQGGAQTNITGAKGSIHTNGTVTVGGNNASVSGFVTATGGCGGSTDPNSGTCGSLTVGDPDATGGGAEARDVPDVDPRTLYPFSQYDLCPGGEIRGGPDYPDPNFNNDTSTPCGGQLLADVDITGPYRGWTRDPGDTEWRFAGNASTEGGVFYAYQRNVYINPAGGSGIWEASVITESTPAAHPHACGHGTGDIVVAANTKMRYYPGQVAPNMLIAGRVLDIGAGVISGDSSFEGFMFAHERFRLSAGADLGGAIVSKNVCATGPNEIQGGVDFNYNGNAFAPPDGIPTAIHWLEL